MIVENEHWEKHPGDGSPEGVAPETVVDVLFRDGEIIEGCAVKLWALTPSNWDHNADNDPPAEIVAWRRHRKDEP